MRDRNLTTVAPSPEELVRSQAERVYRLCQRLVDNVDDAEECAQETLLRAVRALASYRGKASVSTWVYQIAVNVCRNWRRSQRNTTERLRYGRHTTAEDELPIPGSYDTPPDTLARAQAVDAVTKAVQRLPARQRLAVVLREMEEMSYEDIAGTMGVPVGTVRSVLFRARRKLAKELTGVWP